MEQAMALLRQCLYDIRTAAQQGRTPVLPGIAIWDRAALADLRASLPQHSPIRLVPSSRQAATIRSINH